MRESRQPPDYIRSNTEEGKIKAEQAMPFPIPTFFCWSNQSTLAQSLLPIDRVTIIVSPNQSRGFSPLIWRQCEGRDFLTQVEGKDWLDWGGRKC